MALAAGTPPPAVRAFVRWVLRHGALLWAIAIVAGIPAVLRTASLYAHIKSDIEELLPGKAQSVRALDEMRLRFPGLQFLGVVAIVPADSDLPGAERFMQDLAKRVRAYPPGLVRSVRADTSEEKAFVENHAALYADRDDLVEIRRRIEARRDYETAKASGQLLDDTEMPPSVDISDIERKYEARGAEAVGHLTNRELRATMLAIEAGDFSTGAEKARALLDRVKRDVANLDPSAYVPGMQVGYASDIAISAEELSALEVDLSVSSVLVVIAVMAAIVLFYRWWRSIPALIPPLLLATAYSFGLASLPPFSVTALNTNTAFLGSIIIGNGINVGLILLARYREERWRGASVEEALVVGVWGARTGTLVAAGAAGAAYASLAATEFRGFQQFGYIGGIGMLMSWVTAFILVPPLLGWLERDDPTTRASVREPGHITQHIVHFVERAAPWILVVAAGVTVAAAMKLSTFDRSQLEYDFNKLRRVDTWKDGEGYWGRKMDALLGHYLTPTIILCDTPDHARSVEALVRESVDHGVLGPMVAQVLATRDVLPDEQASKIQEVERIRRVLTPRIRSLIPDEKRAVLDRLLGPTGQRPIVADDLPRALTLGLRESDGTMGNTVLVFPRPSDALWHADSIRLFVKTLRGLAAQGAGGSARPGRVAGSIPLSDDILYSIGRDAPIASAVSFLAVCAVLLLLVRPIAGYVIASMVLGALWLGGATMLLGIKINFSNFVAFPITFGIGVDYAANVMARYAQDGKRSIGGAVRSTGGAVALCSLTTIIGYSSLLLAKNRALFLFGLVAVMGEIACLTAAVIVLPAFLVIRRKPSVVLPSAAE
jgi:uncharacterized protein